MKRPIINKEDPTPWRPVFAFLPHRTIDGYNVWLEMVETRKRKPLGRNAFIIEIIRSHVELPEPSPTVSKEYWGGWIREYRRIPEGTEEPK